MYYYSTRDKDRLVKLSASEAILKGLSKDGGLFVPSQFDKLSDKVNIDLPYSEFAYEVLSPFFEGDLLQESLKEICASAFNFPVVLKELKDCSILELFHGPTSAFKDFGARFLSFSMEKLLEAKNEKLCILVATSGDTGGAVASAFHNRNNLSVKVLYPKGRVALRQRKQLTCWDNNITSYEVSGSFDDCQRMVKQAFVDPTLTGLSSANSINLGRLLPQMVYYVYASMLYKRRYNKEPVIIIPSGNVGNSTGAYWAKAIGAPIKRVVLALNSNSTVSDYLSTGEYTPRDSIQTLANAMDVGAPSNMERLFNLFDSYEKMKENVSAYCVSDEKIEETIKREYEKESYILCPHTACAEYVREKYFNNEDVIIVSTAHPAKFETIVEPLIGKTIKMPGQLEALVNKESSFISVDCDYKKLF